MGVRAPALYRTVYIHLLAGAVRLVLFALLSRCLVAILKEGGNSTWIVFTCFPHKALTESGLNVCYMASQTLYIYIYINIYIYCDDV